MDDPTPDHDHHTTVWPLMLLLRHDMDEPLDESVTADIRCRLVMQLENLVFSLSLRGNLMLGFECL